MAERDQAPVRGQYPGSDEVHLWSMDLQRNSVASDPQPCLTLDSGERRRADCFALPEARNRFILTRTLVRNVLSFYRPSVKPVDWRFARNAHGKPEIELPVLPAPLFFNVSHCETRLVMAVAGWPTLGVDVERAVASRRSLAVAKRFFCREEHQWLCDQAPEQRAACFYSLWTLKEAFSKALGGALVPSLKQVSLAFSGQDGIVATVASHKAQQATAKGQRALTDGLESDGSDGEVESDEHGWEFNLYSDDDHLLALAVRRAGGAEPVRCLVKEVDDPMQLACCRKSAFVLQRRSRQPSGVR